MLDFSNLNQVLPSKVYESLLPVVIEFKIDSINRLAHFISQCSHESSNFTRVEENLNYSEEALLKIFPKYFTPKLAEDYARKPKFIANKIYADRMGNGSEMSNDGWNYRGRGYIQLTGKQNYINFDKICQDNIVANPDLVATKYPLVSAAWFWKINGLNELADRGSDAETVSKITKKVNGGSIGLSDRIIKFNKILGVLKYE